MYLLLHDRTIVIFAHKIVMVHQSDVTAVAVGFMLTIAYLRFITELITATKQIITANKEIINDIFVFLALTFILTPPLKSLYQEMDLSSLYKE